MGMAAGQARLLSITARMSDNELRAQIINNNKMRLATQSSQVSEAYVTALNEAQLMFSNYDANDNVSYQQLTFNALTSYNPYNNQYVLSNASGNVLISELDAKNYESVKNISSQENRLDVFLNCYGLEKTTTYFNETLAAALSPSDFVKDTSSNPVNTVHLPQYDESGRQKVDSSGNLLTWDTGYTIEQLQDMYEGNNGYQGYMQTLSTQPYYTYQTALANYNTAKESYEAYVSQVLDFKLDEMVKKVGDGYEGLDDLIKAINGVTVMTGDGDNATELLFNLNEDNTKNLINYTAQVLTLINIAESNGNEYTDKDGKTVSGYYLNPLDANNNIYPTQQAVFGDSGLNQLAAALSDIHLSINNNSTPGNITSDRYFQNLRDTIMQNYGSFHSDIYNIGEDLVYDKNTGIFSYKDENGQSVKYAQIDSSKSYIQYYNDDDSLDTTTYVYTLSEDETVLTIQEPSILADLQSVLLDVLNSLSSNLSKVWNMEGFQGSTHRGDDGLPSDADEWLNFYYDNYKEAADELGKAIFGQKNSRTDDTKSNFVINSINGKGQISFAYNQLGSFLDLYTAYNDLHTGESLNANDMWSFGSSFQPILQSLILDEVMNTYGEPMYAYIDTSSPNASYSENGQAKAQWYTNLFNRIEDGGYKTIKDGLASSAEWIKFAFESGTVIMEQVDDKFAWNKMVYTNCSDITEQTSDAAVTKAEAEYRAAMNKIENKDKRYDMELKNIDTEHTALQTEYESIKTAVEKNIERTFKMYS